MGLLETIEGAIMKHKTILQVITEAFRSVHCGKCVTYYEGSLRAPLTTSLYLILL
jgi:hypothetical protein